MHAQAPGLSYRVRLSMTCLTVVLALSLTTSIAAALRSFSLSAAGEFRAVGRALTFEAEELRFQYNVTFTGTLARSIPKTRGAHVGSITRGVVEGCRVIEPSTSTCSATAAPLGELSWNINYESFLGTLPNVTGILLLIEGEDLLIAEAVMGRNRRECLYRGTIGLLARVGARGEVGGFSFVAGRNLLTLFRDLNLSGLCSLVKSDRGELSFSPTQTLRLI
jgi:hypothetical protein